MRTGNPPDADAWTVARLVESRPQQRMAMFRRFVGLVGASTAALSSGGRAFHSHGVVALVATRT